jgi:hypothetical protein
MQSTEGYVDSTLLSYAFFKLRKTPPFFFDTLF